MKHIIIDGNYQVNRAIYADIGMKMSNSQGQYTGGIYILLRILWQIKEKMNDGKLTVVFDHGHSAYRKSIYPEYKLRGPVTEADRDIQLEEAFDFTYAVLKKLLPRMGIPTFSIPGEEADDVIYRLAEQLEGVTVGTDDSDYLQFITIGSRVYRPMKDILIDKHNFVEVMGFKPEYFTLYKAMQGDGSDNISGIKGIGEATAKKIILAITEPTIEKILEHCVNNSKFAWATKIIENKHILERNMKLIDLREIPLTKETVFEAYQRSLNEAVPNLEYVHGKFKALEIKTLGTWLHYVATACAASR
jgi:DNA polymerase-1